MYSSHSPAQSNTSLSDDDDDYGASATSARFFRDNDSDSAATITPAQWSSRRGSAPLHSQASRLPPEILIHILKHIHSTRDLYSALLVSRAWCECSVELLWYRPSFSKFSTLVKMMRVLSRDDKTFLYAQFIRRLNFLCVGGDLSDSLFSRLAHCIRLERLTLINCTALSDEGLSRVLPNCPSLVALDLTHVSEVTDRSIVALAASAKRLQGINLTGCKKLTDESVLALAANCPLLRRVKLSGVEHVTDESVSALARSCPLLLEIDLHNCKKITDISVRDLWTHSVQMREMRLSHCVELTDAAFPASPKRDILPPGANPFPSAFVLPDELQPLRVSQPFEQLRMLDLTACSHITDDAIEGIVSVAPKIRNLVLSKCSQLTDTAVESICKLGKGLHYLHLGHAQAITDRSINSLVRSCTRLRYIDLANCIQLTDMSVFELSSLQKLRRIGLVRVNNLTDQAIQALGERHSTLERIHLSYCDQISVMAIHFLLQKLPKLTHLSLTGIPAFRRAELQQFCRAPPADFNTTQRAAFCVYSGKGVAELREFLAELFASITNELATSNDTDYEDDYEEADENHRGPDIEVMNEDDDEDDTASEVFVAQPEPVDAHATPRIPERAPIPPDDLASRSGYPVSRELVMMREPRRQATARAQPRAQPANTPAWLNVSTTRRRGFAQQPIVEQSTSPTPSEAASNRSAGTSHSTGTAFFRTYADAPGTARSGVMTPDLIYAEIGHGRGAGPGPSTILDQTHGRREPVVESSFPSAASSPTRHTITLPQSSIGMAASEVFSAPPRPFRMHEHDTPRVEYIHDRGPILHDTSNSYLRGHEQPTGSVGFGIIREASPTTRELQESVHSAFAAGTATPMDVDARGRSVKRTLRSTFAAAETFFTGRSVGGGGPDGAGMAPGRDVDTHGH
ncbi:RNI-like protein [Polyporus arcularius HHB13444]|uniref:RNI-like protein n=1 Tax=Polyporus arcularius HHB13444 TaxID=1314778 RepID=A0A5C3PUU7_9APHY|nr:RNI-like protein [Polyporus arcularius HHB13444]